jgi:shikimate 5-dehydrogenase
MKTSLSRGIISDHFRGVGTVTRDMVRQRAREIAIINGRPPNHCSRQDFLEAQRELTGAIPGLDDEEGLLINTTPWGEEPVSAGHPVDKEEAADEQTVGEELIEQGINEAEHDQMVQAAKSRQVF